MDYAPGEEVLETWFQGMGFGELYAADDHEEEGDD